LREAYNRGVRPFIKKANWLSFLFLGIPDYFIANLPPGLYGYEIPLETGASWAYATVLGE